MKTPVKTDRLYNELKDKISRRELRPGTLLPKETDFAFQNNVSRFTLRAVLKRLEEESLIERVRGHGTYVSSGPKPTDISVLIPCADFLTRSKSSGIQTRHFLSGVLEACSRHHCRLHTIEFSRTNSETDIDWRNLAALDVNSRLIIFSFWYSHAFDFIRNSGCRVLVTTAKRNWHLEFNKENYPHIPFFHQPPPANWSFLTPDIPGAAQQATSYLIHKRNCKRPALALSDPADLIRPPLLDGYMDALLPGMEPLVINLLKDIPSPGKLGELQKKTGFDGLLLDVYLFGGSSSRYNLPEDFPIVRYPSTLDDTAPCILDDYQMMGELAVRALLQKPAPEEVYPLKFKAE